MSKKTLSIYKKDFDHSEIFDLPTIVVNNNGKIVNSNKSFHKFSGLNTEHIENQKLSSFIPGFKRILNSAGKKFKNSITVADFHFTSEKKVLPVNINVNRLSPNKDLYTVTLQKKDHKTAKNLKVYYEDLFESVKAVVWRADAKTFGITYVSKEAENLLGFPRQKWLEERSFRVDRIYEPDREWAVNYCINETKAHRHHELEYRMITFSGEIIWIRDTIRLIFENEEPKEMIGLMIDITKEKKIIEDLVNNKVLLDAAQHLAFIGSFEWDISKNKIIWSDELFTIYGVKSQTSGITFETFLSRIHPEDRNTFQKNIKKAFREKKSFVSEERIIRPSGEIRYLQTKSKFILDENGNIRKLIGVCQDVTEQTQAKEALRRETIFVDLLKNVAIAANEANTVDDAVSFCLKEVCANTNWTLGHAYLLSPADDEMLVSTRLWCISNSKKYKSFKSATESKNLRTGVGLTGRVLKSKKAEWIIDLAEDNNFPRKEHAVESGLKSGCAFPVLIGNKVVGVLEFFSGNEIKPDMKLLEVMSNIGTQIGRVIERKRSENRIIHNEEKFRALAETANDGIVTTDLSGTIIYFNKEAEKIFGYKKDEILGKKVSVLIPQEYHNTHLEEINKFLRTAEKKIIGQTTELEGVNRKGKIFPIELSLASWKTEEGTFFTAIIRDITERKNFIKSLHNRASQQAAIAELGQAAIAENDVNKILNKAVELVSRILKVEYAKVLELTGDKKELLIRAGVGWKKGLVGYAKVGADFNSQAGYTLFKDNEVIVKDLRKEKRFSGATLLHEHKVVSGLSVPIHGMSKSYGVLGAHTKELRSFDNDDINFMKAIANIIATAIDKIKAAEELKLTYEKLKNTQSELIHSEKLAALGRFSSSIAHEIRNPLANISASAQFALSKFDIDERMKRHLNMMLRNTESANRIIKELLDFASPRGIYLDKNSIENVINTVYDLVHSRCKSNNIKLIRKIEKELPPVNLNKEKLEEAFQNFISNSIDAMPKGGKIIISAFSKKDNVVVTFEDMGTGIDPVYIDNIMEPFFTTKEKGTGLGLSLAHQIIKAHNGHMMVKSSLGKGTIIEINIPV